MTLGLELGFMGEPRQGSGGLAQQILDNLQYEPNGAVFHFKGTPSALIRHVATPANNFAGDANSKLVYTSPSNKYVRNASGVYEAGTTLRCDHVSGVPQGVLVEGARTNSIRNNSMQGAVAGTPGTVPTNWAAINSGGCSWSVIGTGMQNGIEYVDVRLQGTAASGFCEMRFESLTQIVAAAGQSWASTFFCYLVSGSLTGISSAANFIREGDGVGTLTAQSSTSFTPNDTTTLSSALRTHTVASTNASTLRIINRLGINEAASGAVDATFRIGWPQLELGAFASSPIRTTSAAVTRAADDISLAVANFPSMSSGGYMTARFVPSQVVAVAHRAFGLYQNASNTNFVGGNTTGKRAANLIATVGAPSLTPTGTLAARTATTIAYSFAVNNYKAASDGGAIQTSVSGATLPTYIGISFGSEGMPGSVAHLFGWLQWAKIVPRTNLTDAQVVTESALAL